VRAGRDDGVDALEFGLGKLQVERLQVVLELPERAQADDGARDAGLVEDPRERELRERDVPRLGEGTVILSWLVAGGGVTPACRPWCLSCGDGQPSWPPSPIQTNL
jgi:hypothetical protein